MNISNPVALNKLSMIIEERHSEFEVIIKIPRTDGRGKKWRRSVID